MRAKSKTKFQPTIMALWSIALKNTFSMNSEREYRMRFIFGVKDFASMSAYSSLMYASSTLRFFAGRPSA